MAIVKPAGAPPRYADPLRREVRDAVRAHDRGQRAGALAADQARAAAEATAALAALGDVRNLDAAGYA
jgi:hypothetical protein